MPIADGRIFLSWRFTPMLRPLIAYLVAKLPPLLGAGAFFTVALLATNSNGQSTNPQSAGSQTTSSIVYFPPDAIRTPATVFSSFLTQLGEPSLLAAAQDSNIHSYRFEYIASFGTRLLVVRLSLHPDGSARILVADQYGNPLVLHRSQENIAPGEVEKFVQLVETANFWRTSTTEPKLANNGRKVYKLDASIWVLEGVRDATYHVVVRSAPEPSPFT